MLAFGQHRRATERVRSGPEMVNIIRIEGPYQSGEHTMTLKTVLVAAGSAAAIAAAGCATQAPMQAAGSDPYAAAIYTGAPQPDVADQYAYAEAPLQRSANGAPFEIVSYVGIEGARRAHALYTEADAEALDGRCEANIRPAAYESMIDIADLCDVPLDVLVEYNPGVANISYETTAARLRIPGGMEDPKGFAALAGALVELQSVQQGDTLEKIAYRLNVQPAALANLNPNIDWAQPVAGQAFVSPASVTASAPPQHSYAPAEPAPAWEGYASLANPSSGGGHAVAGTPHAPYNLKPTKSYASAVGVYPDAKVATDREYVNVGESVRVSSGNFTPDAEVTFFYGDEPGELKRSKTVRADQNGNASASVRIKKKSNMGGVVFGAREVGTSDTKYSDRVTVLKLRPDGKSENVGVDDEAASEE